MIADEQFGVGKLTVSHQSVSVDDIICISVLLQTSFVHNLMQTSVIETVILFRGEKSAL